jgi:hypothetical protein
MAANERTREATRIAKRYRDLEIGYDDALLLLVGLGYSEINADAMLAPLPGEKGPP